MASHPHRARTKRAKNTGAASGSYDAHLFPSAVHAERFATFDALPADPGRLFTAEVLEFFDIPSIPGVQINRILDMMRIPASVNLHAVKLFYCNLTDRKDANGRLKVQMSSSDEIRPRLWTYLYGRELEITPADICSILGVPVDGGANLMTDFHGVPFYQLVFGVPHVEDSAWRSEHALRAVRMPQAHRVLHLYLAHNYFPRVGRHSSTTFTDLWVMYRLLTGELINFWDVMVTNFKKVANGPQRALLRHSRFITLLLQRKGIRFESPTSTVSREPFTMASLPKSEWRKVADGSYVRKKPLSPIHGITLPLASDEEDEFDGAGGDDDDGGGDAAPMAEGAAPPDVPMAEPEPAPAPLPMGGPDDASVASLTQAFTQFQVDIDQRFTDLRTEMRTSFSSLAETQSKMYSDMDAFFQHFYSIHPRPPPPPDA